jgi:hypothetical protein
MSSNKEIENETMSSNKEIENETMSSNKEIENETMSSNKEIENETVTTNDKRFICIVNKTENVVVEIIDINIVKHPVLYEYLNSTLLTDNRFINSLVMCIYLRKKLQYQLDETHPFYQHISHVDDSKFLGVENSEFTDMLYYCVSFSASCIYYTDGIEDADKMKIIEVICKYRNVVVEF